MGKNIKKKPELMRIGELAKAAGVSPTTIHYYMREGLIAPARKTARNMAYYDRRSVDEILLIKDLQAKKYYPLNVIKSIITRGRAGAEHQDLIEMRSFLNGIFQTDDTGREVKRFTLEELSRSTGITPATLRRLKKTGLLVPWETKDGPYYDDIDENICRVIRELEIAGLKEDDFQVFVPFIKAVRQEVKTMHAKLPREIPEKSVATLVQSLYNLNHYLTVKICRKAILELHQDNG